MGIDTLMFRRKNSIQERLGEDENQWEGCGSNWLGKEDEMNEKVAEDTNRPQSRWRFSKTKKSADETGDAKVEPIAQETKEKEDTSSGRKSFFRGQAKTKEQKKAKNSGEEKATDIEERAADLTPAKASDTSTDKETKQSVKAKDTEKTKETKPRIKAKAVPKDVEKGFMKLRDTDEDPQAETKQSAPQKPSQSGKSFCICLTPPQKNTSYSSSLTRKITRKGKCCRI